MVSKWAGIRKEEEDVQACLGAQIQGRGAERR
jgi:hypothetical protein